MIHRDPAPLIHFPPWRAFRLLLDFVRKFTLDGTEEMLLKLTRDPLRRRFDGFAASFC